MSESFDIRKKEYTALRREIGNDLEEISDLERNCFSAAAVAYSWLIFCVAKETGVAARPIHAIMYMEATHGYYDAPLSLFGQNKSLLPMNVNIDY